jgi:hypothetical protein
LLSHQALEALGMFADACCAVAIARHFCLRQLRRALHRLVRSASLYERSLLSFGLMFVRRRLGGGAQVAALAVALGARVSASRGGATAFEELVARRVFGGCWVQAIVRSMRAEMIRMQQSKPVCAFLLDLQVMVHCACGGGYCCCLCNRFLCSANGAFVFAGGGAKPHRRTRRRGCSHLCM